MYEAWEKWTREEEEDIELNWTSWLLFDKQESYGWMAVSAINEEFYIFSFVFLLELPSFVCIDSSRLPLRFSWFFIFAFSLYWSMSYSIESRKVLLFLMSLSQGYRTKLVLFFLSLHPSSLSLSLSFLLLLGFPFLLFISHRMAMLHLFQSNCSFQRWNDIIVMTTLAVPSRFSFFRCVEVKRYSRLEFPLCLIAALHSFQYSHDSLSIPFFFYFTLPLWHKMMALLSRISAKQHKIYDRANE